MTGRRPVAIPAIQAACEFTQAIRSAPAHIGRVGVSVPLKFEAPFARGQTGFLFEAPGEIACVVES